MDKEQYKSFIIGLKPTLPCHSCGSTDWWFRQNRWSEKGDWLCRRCHPDIQEVKMSTEEKHFTENGEEEVPATAVHLPFKLEPPEKAASALIRNQTHIQYRLQNGSPVPGVTTVLSVYNSRKMQEQLMQWSWNLGQQGLDWKEVRDSAARVGTFTHYLIMCQLKNERPKAPSYNDHESQKANICLAKFNKWLKDHSLTPVMIEEPLVSDELRYGGTPDLLAEMDGEFALIDFKTGNGIYESYFYQVAAYRQLLEEQGWPVAGARILRIGTNENEDFEEVIRTNLDREFEIFKHCLEIYRLQQNEAR